MADEKKTTAAEPAATTTTAKGYRVLVDALFLASGTYRQGALIDAAAFANTKEIREIIDLGGVREEVI